MRRIVLFLAAALLVAGADTARAQMVTAGLQGGLNMATADVKGSIFTGDVGTRTGFHLGVMAKTDITPYFAVRVDVFYSQKGFSEGSGDIALDVNFVEIPIYFVIQIPGTIQPYLLLGAVLGLQTSCNVSSGNQQNIPCDEITTLPSTKGADSGLTFGLGAATKLGPGSIFADAIYNYGLTDISEPSIDVDSIKTRTFYLSLGYMFSVGNTSQ
jgi:hypothetical protein